MKKCQFCAEEVQDEAIVCKHCGKELNKRAVQKKEYKWTLGRISCAVILVPIVLVVVISMARNSGDSGQTSNSIAVQKVSVGEEGFLRMPNKSGEDVLLATTEKNFDDFMKASIAGDTMGATDVVLNGGAYYVVAGTKAKVIDTSVGKRKVRILDGGMVGKVGWIPFEYISK